MPTSTGLSGRHHLPSDPGSTGGGKHLAPACGPSLATEGRTGLVTRSSLPCFESPAQPMVEVLQKVWLLPCAETISLPMWPRLPLEQDSLITAPNPDLPLTPEPKSHFSFLPRGPGYPCSPELPKPRRAPAHAATSAPTSLPGPTRDSSQESQKSLFHLDYALKCSHGRVRPSTVRAFIHLFLKAS